jgi:hypothetical protein
MWGTFAGFTRRFWPKAWSHAGIIVVYRQRYAVGEQLRRLLALVNLRSAEEMRGCLHFIFEVAV